MPIKTHVCVSVTCDVCGTPLQDFEDDGTLYFPGEPEARDAARYYRWPIASGGRFVCPTTDPGHQAAMDELLPPAPTLVPDGQGELFEDGAR